LRREKGIQSENAKARDALSEECAAMKNGWIHG
jgi:hypothetical protein